MTKIDSNFAYDVFRFLHKPIRDLDAKEGKDFLDRFLTGPQHIFEDNQDRIQNILTLNDPSTIRADLLQYLKDIVGFTKELSNITDSLSDNDLRKLISIAVALWKQKGLEKGYRNIVRLLTGKSSRTFNWFDYRLIVGEKALGSEFLGDDSWYISVPGVEENDHDPDVVALIPFNGDTKDKSVIQNNAVDHANVDYFIGAGIDDDRKYAHFDGGINDHLFPGDIVSLPYVSDYNFDGDFTIEMFVKSGVTGNKTLFNYTNGIKLIKIEHKAGVPDFVAYTLDDGSTSINGTANVASSLDDGTWRHIALVVNRTQNLAKIYVNGIESSAGEDITALGNLTIKQPMYIGGQFPGNELFRGGISDFRLSIKDQYDPSNATIPPPGALFIEYQEEALDEYKTDIRIVDDGTLDRTLMKRALNIMRPCSERLVVIYVDFFEDFVAGKGDLTVISPGAYTDSGYMVMPAGSIERVNITDGDQIRDMVLQVKQKFDTSGEFIIRFFVQDTNNYYRFVIDYTNQVSRLEKVVAGVPTQLGSDVAIPISPDTDFIWTVITDYNDIEDESSLRCYQDNNLLLNEIDSTFNKGYWSVESSTGQSSVSDIEMFLMPLDLEYVEPGFSL